MLLEPSLYLVVKSRYFSALGADWRQLTGLHTLRDLVNVFIAQLTITRQRKLFCILDISGYGFPISSGLKRDLTRALLHLPTSQYFSDIDHVELPVGHRLLPTTTRVVFEGNLVY